MGKNKANWRMIKTLIAECNNKTFYIQLVLCVTLMFLCCRSFGFNDKLIYWLAKMFNKSDFENISGAYVGIIGLLCFMFTRIIFSFITVVKYFINISEPKCQPNSRDARI